MGNGFLLMPAGIIQPSHQVCAFTGIGISCLVEQDPKQRDTDFLMDDAQHQDIDMAATKFPIRTVQSQVPRLVLQPHDMNNQPGDTGFVEMNMLEKTFKPAMHG